MVFREGGAARKINESSNRGSFPIENIMKAMKDKYGEEAVIKRFGTTDPDKYMMHAIKDQEASEVIMLDLHRARKLAEKEWEEAQASRKRTKVPRPKWLQKTYGKDVPTQS
jgi:hypothetical protein